MKIQVGAWFLAVAVVLCLGGAPGGGAANDSLATKCAGEFQKVMPCLSFATAKAETPSKDCCDSVTTLKNSDPECLCWIIQQIHNGTSEAVRSTGVQEARLLQLPSACKLANASVAECPKLLHLPPNSPDAAIFNNVTAATTPSSGGGGTPASGGSSARDKSVGMWREPGIAGRMIVAVGVSVLLGLSPSLS